MRRTFIAFLVAVMAIVASDVADAKPPAKKPQKVAEPPKCPRDGQHHEIKDVDRVPNGIVDLPAGYAVSNLSYYSWYRETDAACTEDGCKIALHKDICVKLRRLEPLEKPEPPTTYSFDGGKLRITLRAHPPLPEENETRR